MVVVVSNFEMTAQFVVHLHAHGNGFRGNPVGLADSRMRFQKTKAVFKFHPEGILPSQIAGMTNTRECGFAMRFLELNGCFYVEILPELPAGRQSI